ncbi:Crp/Fnr family transcriptional regulator [Algoriphagus kandeliae]|uniref:Crp/Fnr family transcriptional regulator n=1 Tax=Algoriphagus kandeliae TaxID=2562278 RepID=A0A4Y9QV58_9BACT|nr:Crp/Fnr family transcriptional regulator [Algoriphagus kandeliae]TFV96030.1 Crp/Fnr family transcriptional regulator [Algoriphagus kandeliae]
MKLFNNLETVTVAKGTILQQAGETTTKGYRVAKGCLKSYVLDRSGKEHILQFAPEDWLITDMDSFFHQLPSNMFIEAIEDSEVEVYSRAVLTEIENWETEALKQMNVKLRNNLIATNKRLIAMLSATAEERYIGFTETYPTLVQRLPLKLIASYIGITPEYLSEIRRKIARK